MIRHIGLQFWSPLRGAVTSNQQSLIKAVKAQMASLQKQCLSSMH